MLQSVFHGFPRKGLTINSNPQKTSLLHPFPFAVSRAVAGVRYYDNTGASWADCLGIAHRDVCCAFFLAIRNGISIDSFRISPFPAVSYITELRVYIYIVCMRFASQGVVRLIGQLYHTKCQFSSQAIQRQSNDHYCTDRQDHTKASFRRFRITTKKTIR